MTSERDSFGRLQADPQRFPHGIAYLADYVSNMSHSQTPSTQNYLAIASFPGPHTLVLE